MSSILWHGDSLQELKNIPDNSIDSIVTDPPYGLSFMGKKWDYDVPSVEIWQEALRVLKPGGHLLSFGGTRTYHRLASAVEDAGFEIRDQIQWIYGSGFPKSHNLPGGVGTALKPANEPIVLARKPLIGTVAKNVAEFGVGGLNIDASRIEGAVPSTIQGQSSKQGEIYGADQRDQKVFHGHTQGRWPANVLFDEEAAALLDEQSGVSKSTGGSGKVNRDGDLRMGASTGTGANVGGLGDSGGASRFFYVAKASKRERNAGLEGMIQWESETWQRPDLNSLMENMLQLAKDISDATLMAGLKWNTETFGSGSADQSQKATTFIISTALKLITELKTSNVFQSSSTRESIRDAIGMIEANGSSLVESAELINQLRQSTISAKTESPLGVVHALLKTLSEVKGFAKSGNFHSTVKPIKLMQYLVRLVTPAGGIVLDPFMGSGTTGCACVSSGFDFIGIEREAEYIAIAERRIAAYEVKKGA